MNYKFIPTTVFTPIEYGCMGYSEEDAIEKFGGIENLKIYHTLFKPLEWNFYESHDADYGYIKLITLRNEEEKIVGFHYLGPHAGEVTQGYAVAIAMGAKKSDFAKTVGIHPTYAEEIIGLHQVKGEGEVEKSGC